MPYTKVDSRTFTLLVRCSKIGSYVQKGCAIYAQESRSLKNTQITITQLSENFTTGLVGWKEKSIDISIPQTNAVCLFGDAINETIIKKGPTPLRLRGEGAQGSYSFLTFSPSKCFSEQLIKVM